MKALLVILLVALTWGSSDAKTLEGLINDFRIRAGEKDSSKSIASDADIRLFLDHAQARIAKVGGYLPKRVNIAYVEGTLIYTLPSTYKYLDDKNGVLLRSADDWIPMLFNPGFLKDTTAPNYTVAFVGGDTAKLYLSGRGFAEDDTIVVHFYGAANNLSFGTECDFPNDQEVYVVDEALLLYEQAKRDWAGFQLLYQSQRQDMGVEKQVRK